MGKTPVTHKESLESRSLGQCEDAHRSTPRYCLPSSPCSTCSARVELGGWAKKMTDNDNKFVADSTQIIANALGCSPGDVQQYPFRMVRMARSRGWTVEFRETKVHDELVIIRSPLGEVLCEGYALPGRVVEAFVTALSSALQNKE